MYTKYELIHVATRLPDYWGGHHLPHISIAVYEPMTLKQIKTALHCEVSQDCIAGSQLDQIPYRAFHAAINRLGNKSGFRGKHFTDIDFSEDDHIDPVYAYFVFVPFDEVN